MPLSITIATNCTAMLEYIELHSFIVSLPKSVDDKNLELHNIVSGNENRPICLKIMNLQDILSCQNIWQLLMILTKRRVN